MRQGCTNPWCQFALATKFCTMAPKILGSSVWNFLHVMLLAPTILKWFPDFLTICAPLVTDLLTYLLVNHIKLLRFSESYCTIYLTSTTTRLENKATKTKFRQSSDDTVYLCSENPTFRSRTTGTSIMTEVWHEAWFSSVNKRNARMHTAIGRDPSSFILSNRRHIALVTAESYRRNCSNKHEFSVRS